MTKRLFTISLVAALLAAACSEEGSPARNHPPVAAAPVPTAGQVGVYVALGASETIGIGAAHPNAESWPQVFYQRTLPRATVFYNLGIPAETLAQAIDHELPIALSLRPNLATVWFNFNDLVAGVSAADYEQQLGNLVHQLRAGSHAQVLIANTPVLDRLPAYASCGSAPPSGSPRCPRPGQVLPAAPELNSLVDAYNASIVRVAAREGATLVDLHAQGDVPLSNPEFISSDGFHPSTAGHAAIAAAFTTAYQLHPP